MGRDIVDYPPKIDWTSFSRRRSRWLQASKTTVVLDVGANVGQYATEVRASGYRGRIVSFEPQSSAFRVLQETSAKDHDWKALNVALGSREAVAELNIAGNSESSSFLPMEDIHIGAYPPSAYVGKESVRVTTLDSVRNNFLTVDDRVWLKIDVQGLEISVLEGAAQTLPQVGHIEMELSIVPLYAGSPVLCAAIDILAQKGYQLIGLEEGFLDQQDAHALQLNGIFKRMPA